MREREKDNSILRKRISSLSQELIENNFSLLRNYSDSQLQRNFEPSNTSVKIFPTSFAKKKKIRIGGKTTRDVSRLYIK